jgi:hypothetical protein
MKGDRVLTITFGDLHIGDEGFLYDLWLRSVDKWVEKVRELNPDKIILIDVGDTASGDSVYRNQHYENVVGKTDWQDSCAVEVILEMIEMIRTESDAPITLYLFPGNHHNRTSNIEIAIHKDVTRWNNRLNFNAYYKGDMSIIDIGNKGNRFDLLCFHGGAGGSSYYPIPYSSIRAIQKYLTCYKTDAILCGHYHWFSVVRFDWGGPNGVKWYVNGGYQSYASVRRQYRFNAYSAKPVGNWLFFNGKEIEITVDLKKVKWLEFMNFKYAGEILMRYMDRLEECGYTED